MGVTKHRDLIVRGTTFSNVSAAADHFGVHPDTVRNAIRRGALDRLGVGHPGLAPCPVRIRGVDYPSARAAAAALGVTKSHVLLMLRKCRADTVGLGPRCGVQRLARPFTVGGVTYASMAEADRSLGLARGYVARSLRLGRKSAIEKIVAAAMAREAEKMTQARPADTVRLGFKRRPKVVRQAGSA